MRIKERNEHNKVALTVIYFLGGIAFLATAWSGYLIHESVVSDNEITSASVALIGQMVSIATLALGALGAMLSSSTSPKPAPPPVVTDSAGGTSTPVTIVNPPEDPVETHPTATTDEPLIVDPVAPDEPPVEGAPDEEPQSDKPARRRR